MKNKPNNVFLERVRVAVALRQQGLYAEARKAWISAAASAEPGSASKRVALAYAANRKAGAR